MRLIDWISPNGKIETKQNIKKTFEKRLEGRKIAISLGPLLLLYWFPPWSLGYSTRGTPNHSLITESFSFIGFVKEKEQETHLIGFSFFRIIFRLFSVFYVFVLLIIWEDIVGVMVGLATFGMFWTIVWGIFERSAEDNMNDTVRKVLEMVEFE